MRELEEHAARYFYNARTAREILESGNVVTCKTAGIRGCHDLAIVALALLKHKGVNATFVRNLGNHRQPNHSYVIAEINNEFFKIDLSGMAKRFVLKITRERMNKIMSEGPVLFGSNPFDAGVTSAEVSFKEESHGGRRRGWK